MLETREDGNQSGDLFNPVYKTIYLRFLGIDYRTSTLWSQITRVSYMGRDPTRENTFDTTTREKHDDKGIMCTPLT